MRPLLVVVILAALAGPAASDVVVPASVDRLGVVVLELTADLKHHYGADRDGVLVGMVEPGSAAYVAGIEVGDVIAQVDGKPIDEAVDVVSALAHKRIGDAIAITVFRNHIPFTVEARLAPSPSAELLHLGAAWAHHWSIGLREIERRIGVGGYGASKQGD